MKRLLIIASFLSLCLADETMIDLTHGLGKTTLYWPANPPFNFSNLLNVSLGVGNSVLFTNYIYTPEHIGTHMDAPRHFCPGGSYVDEIPLEKLSGPGVVLDFQSQAEQNRDYSVTLKDVQNWEATHGPIPTGAVVILKFGWNKYWPNWEQVFNTDDISNSSSYHWPGLSLEASRHIAETRNVHAVGFDVISADPGQSIAAQIHRNLLCDNGIILIENVANVDALPTTGSRVFIGAIKLEQAGGTPVRLFAIVDDNGDANSAREITATLSALCLLVFTAMFV